MGFRVVLQNLSDQSTGPLGYARTSIPWSDDATRDHPASVVGTTEDGRVVRGRVGPVIAQNFVFRRPGAPCFRELEIRGIDLDPFEKSTVSFVFGEPEHPVSVEGDDEEHVPGQAPATVAAGNPVPEIWTGEQEVFLPTSWRTVRESLGGVTLEATGRVRDWAHMKWLFRIRPGYPIVDASLRIINSDPSSSTMIESLPLISIRTIEGVIPWFDFAVERGGGLPGINGDGSWHQVLQGPTSLRKAQQIVFRGAFLLESIAKPEHLQAWGNRCGGGVVAMPHPDELEGCWPVYGGWGEYLGLDTESASVGLYRRFLAGLHDRVERIADVVTPTRAESGPRSSTVNAFTRPEVLLTCDSRPGRTGDQPDFGVSTASPCLAVEGGNPSWLRVADFSLLWDMQRPSHWLKGDGSRISEAEYPNACLWNEDVHVHPRVSVERFGRKPWAAYPGVGDMVGYDLQHWSRNTLHSAYILSGGDELYLSEIENGIENWLMSRKVQEVDKGGYERWPDSVAGTESIRSARAEYTMAWSFACTGDLRIPQRMADRARTAYAHAMDRADAGKAVYVATHRPDGRLLLHKRTVAIWESCLGILGYAPQADLIALVDEELGHRWLKMVRGMCRTWAQVGFVRDGEKWKLIKAVGAEDIDDPGISIEKEMDPNDPKAKWRVDHSGHFDHWVPAALKVCVELVKEHGLSRRLYDHFQSLRGDDRELLGKAVRWQRS